MRNHLSVYPDLETDRLISAVLQRIPQFVNELGDSSLLNEVYFTMRAREHHRGYTWYRFQRSFIYRSSVVDGLLPHGRRPYAESEYKAVYEEPSPADLDTASLVGMLCALCDIFASVCTVYHPKSGRYHYVGKPHTVIHRLLRIAKDTLPFPSTDSESKTLYEDMDPFFEDLESDLLDPFYVFVFRYLRDNGYNWQYRSDYLAASRRIELGQYGRRNDDNDEGKEVDDRWLQPVAPEDLAPGADQYTERNLSDISFESSYFDFVQEGPEPAVRAYIEVYGVEPEGYPPRMDEY